MSITVSFTNNWGESLDSILDSLRFYTPGHDCRWPPLETVDDPEAADYLVALNGLPAGPSGFQARHPFRSLVRVGRGLLGRSPASLRRHSRKIYLQMEPEELQQPDPMSEDYIFYGSYEHHHHVSNWHIRKPFNELKSLPAPDSFKPVSAIVSGKRQTDAQKQRIRTVMQTSRLLPQLDVFGRGLEASRFGESYKGELNENGSCKFRGLYGYRYSLAFENSAHDNYFTEKLVDCFLCWTKPVYWGCPNILDYFPEESVASVDIFDEDAPEMIAEEVTRPVDYDAIREARDLVLQRYNIWPSVARIINRVENRSGFNPAKDRL